MKNFKKLIKESYLGNPLNEVKITPVSGTKSDVTYSLDSDKKLILKKDVKGARIGDYVDVTLPKGTIIYNLPGGVLAAHESLKDLATSSNPYYEKDNYSGIRIIKSRDTLAAIENAANLEESLPGGFHSQEDLDQFLKDMKDDNASFSDEFLDQMMKDQIEHDEETLRRERGLEEELNENKFDDAAMDEYGKPFAELSIAQKQELISYMNRETEKEFKTDYTERRKKMSDYVNEEFKKGDKVTYLGNPGEITFVGKDQMDRTYYSVSYDKGYGKTKASNLYNKGGEIKAVKEDINDPALVRARAAQMKKDQRDREEAEYEAKQAALDKKYGSSFMDKLDAEISLKQELQDLKDEREQLMIDMEQEAEPEGGEVADLYGMKLNRIDLRTAEIKSELEDLRMYESINEAEIPLWLTDNREFEKAVIVSTSYNDFEKRVYHILGPKYFKLALIQHPGVFKDYYDRIRGNRPKTPVDLGEDAELNVNVSNDNDIADEQEANSGVVGESKGFNFKQMVKESLIPKNLR